MDSRLAAARAIKRFCTLRGVPSRNYAVWEWRRFHRAGSNQRILVRCDKLGVLYILGGLTSAHGVDAWESAKVDSS